MRALSTQCGSYLSSRIKSGPESSGDVIGLLLALREADLALLALVVLHHAGQLRSFAQARRMSDFYCGRTFPVRARRRLTQRIDLAG